MSSSLRTVLTYFYSKCSTPIKRVSISDPSFYYYHPELIQMNHTYSVFRLFNIIQGWVTMCVTHNKPLLNRQPAFTGETPRIQISGIHFTAFRVCLGSNEIHPRVKALHRYFFDINVSLDPREAKQNGSQLPTCLTSFIFCSPAVPGQVLGFNQLHGKATPGCASFWKRKTMCSGIQCMAY